MQIVLSVLVGLALVFVLTVAAVWLAGLVQGVVAGDRLVKRARRPIITVLRATTDVAPGATATIHVHVDGAEKCWIDWSGPRSHRERSPKKPLRLSAHDEAVWSCEISSNTRPGLWPVTITAQGSKGRSRVVVPVRIHSTNGSVPVAHEIVALNGESGSAYARPRADQQRPSPKP